ncbi:MAG TPA: hypothetical protein VE860_01000 [Chthoniobacterales bacterium]|nr:hypothetical protein [Chthoniobacterales bacterium]
MRPLQNPTGQLATGERSSLHNSGLRKNDYSLLSGKRLYCRIGTAVPGRTQSQAKQDMPVSSFLLGLVFVGMALAAYADRPLHVAPFHRSIDAESTGSLTALGPEPLRAQDTHE